MSLEQYIQSARQIKKRTYVPSSLPTVNALIQELDSPEKGFRTGRMLDIVGMESSGKTLLALDLVANAQKAGLKVAWADVERQFVPEWAARQGVDLDNLTMIYADTAENNLAVVEKLSRQGYGFIVIDSIPALVPKSHNEESIDDADVDPDYEKNKKMAALGTLLGDFTKRMVPIIDYWNTTLVFINQFRANMSTMARSERKPYGPYTYKHNLTWRLEIARVDNFDGGVTIECKITKNRLGVERKIGKYNIIYGKGLDIESDMLAHAVLAGIVKQTGKGRYEWTNPATGEIIKAHGGKQAAANFDFASIRKQLDHAME